MINKQTRERWNSDTTMKISFWCSIGILIVAILIPDSHSDTRNIFISVGCSILASTIIMYLTSEFMLRSKRRSELIDRWGVESIYKTRAEMNESCNIALDNCKEKIELIAFGLKNFREVKSTDLQNLIDNGVKVKIITLDPSSNINDLVDDRENLVHGSTSKSIKDLIAWAKAINSKRKNSISIKLYNGLPLDFYYRIDRKVFVGPYLKGLSSQQSISYEFSEGEGYRYWKEYFDKIWDESTDASI